MKRPTGIPDPTFRQVEALAKVITAKQPRNQLRTALMNHRRTFENWKLVSELGDLQAVLGWPAKAVETLARRARLEGFTLKGGDIASFGLDEVVEQTQFMRRARQAELNSLVHAVAFEVAHRGGEGEPDVLITHVDATNGTGTWNHRLGELDDFLSVSHWENGEPRDWAYYTRDSIWVCSNGSAERFPQALGRVPVEPLVYKPRLDRPFGSSRISRSVIFLTRSATRVVVRSEATADLYSAPSLLALGLTAAQIEQGSWRQGIGNVVGIPDADEGPVDAPSLARVDIKTINQASQEPHVAQLRAWAQLFAGETSIPVSSLGISIDSNPTSAESYAASREDLIAEAEDAAGEWGEAHRRSLINAFAIREGMSIDDVPSELVRGLGARYRDARHTSQAAAADSFVKLATAIPGLAEADAALDMLGLDAALKERLRADLRRSRSSSMLDALAAAAEA